MILLRTIKQALLALVIWPVAVMAGPATEQLHRFVEEVTTLQANFEQIVVDSQGNVVEEASGKFYLQRPGQFRWDYEQPFAQQIVADGKRLWFYDIDLEQVTVNAQEDALSDSPASLLSGRSVPEDNYNIVEVASDDGLYWLELTPLEADAGFQRLSLAFSDEGLQQMVMTDSFDQRTLLVFRAMQTNPNLPASTFEFVAPAGVDVVGEIDE
ncbi:outer membrane lipoprotein carrier protein LolA [Methylophaga lonarensis MPL]|uniref:Outer-membrane lipoprotein carrier protein n=1 Tax=Methylophaga lonarensis MPL TaxID=1286106 RepID=M7NWH7_9GAMM|nr:outer membrane lipoprotein chaperone LolA [Methylophaga lonarensis]EMR13128.1 outer membrane lipoprotein carrier protein LolA [Methylophaga lonarensis MPL]